MCAFVYEAFKLLSSDWKILSPTCHLFEAQVGDISVANDNAKPHMVPSILWGIG